jgi:hypothetical protein
MVSNDLVMPFVLKRREALMTGSSDVGALLLRCGASRSSPSCCSPISTTARRRRAARRHRPARLRRGGAARAGLLRRPDLARGTARGAIAGMIARHLAWAYTLLLPSVADIGIVGAHVLTDGPFGMAVLRPQALFGLDLPPLVHGVCGASR